MFKDMSKYLSPIVADVILFNEECHYLTQESLDLWAGWLERFPTNLPALVVLDINQATLADWQAFLCCQSYDITLLHGAYVELQANRLPIPYVTALVNVTPDSVIVLA